MRLIGLTGYAGAGKDAAAAGLIENGWTRVALADPLKDVARALGWDGNKDDSGRAFLQTLGESVRNNVHRDVWVWAAKQRIESVDGPVVVTDVRYPNEADMIHELGGVLVRIDRPGVGPINGHESESFVASLPADRVIVNDGTLNDLVERLRP